MRVQDLILLVLLGWLCSSKVSIAAELYQCTGGDGTRNYVSHPIEGQDCRMLTRSVEGRWRFVTVSLKGSVISYDKDTVQRADGAVTAWVQFVHQGDEKPYIPSKGYSSKTLNRERVSCERMTTQTLSFAEYDDKGNVLANGTYLSGSPQPVVPDSVYEAVWQALCRPQG